MAALRAISIVLLALGLVGCTKAAEPPGTVSAACDAALAHEAAVGDADDAVLIPAVREGLTACRTKEEWMAGAERYRGTGGHSVIVGTKISAADAFAAHCTIPPDPKPPICAK